MPFMDFGMLSRRSALFGSAALAGAAVIVRPQARAEPKTSPSAAADGAGQVRTASFDIAERQIALPCFDGKALSLWTFQADPPMPIVRIKQGDAFTASVKNSLKRPGEFVTIHWHGLRVPIVQDGVPFMTQPPIEPGQSGTNSFTPPDTGTFFFHTHCNTIESVGRGLAGVFLVEGDEVAPSDADVVLLMKDWRLSAEGAFLPFMTDEGAAKAGTSGTVRSVNGTIKPVIPVPSSANVRLRFLNVDPVRISEIGVDGADAAIIAVDGNACTPLPLGSWRMGPAQRIDILLRTPGDGRSVKLLDYFAAEPVVLAELAAAGAPKRTDKFVVQPLKPGRYKTADLTNAQRLSFDFGATATGEAVAAAGSADGPLLGPLCLSKKTFWAINKQSWPGMDHRNAGPPLAMLKSGQSYVFELKNLTPHPHPIHIHGHTFEVLTSNLRKLPPHRADTVLLLPKERLEVALVAGAPGRWMFHCHILEHQETGMMGYLDVT
jgi:FtsP/CotA-like multicopper oxidase with cupredoxin domain